MSWRTATFAGFAIVAALWLVWAVITARRPGAVTLGQAVSQLTRSLYPRLIVFLGWAWLGWHLFARGSGA